MLPDRVYAEIDLDAMDSNMRQIIKKMEPAKVMAVIKADAYGHGALRTVKELSDIGVYAFGVATAEEAITLRREGVTQPVLILGYVFESSFDELIINNIDLTLFDLETAQLLQEHAKKLRRTVLVHIKVDTGMGRLGLQPDDESIEIIKSIDMVNFIKDLHFFQKITSLTICFFYINENLVNVLYDELIQLPLLYKLKIYVKNSSDEEKELIQNKINEIKNKSNYKDFFTIAYIFLDKKFI